MRESELEAIGRQGAQAFEALHACAERGGQLRQSIPAREDDDDILIDRALLQIPRLVAEIRRLHSSPNKDLWHDRVPAMLGVEPRDGDVVVRVHAGESPDDMRRAIIAAIRAQKLADEENPGGL